MIRPLAEAIYGPSEYFRCHFFTVSLYDEVAIISDKYSRYFSLNLCQQCDVIAVAIASEHGTHISPK
jgi:hypothetical protein